MIGRTAPNFDPDGAEPLYAQVANYIRGCIESGELRHGQRLPAERDLAAEYGVAYNTVRRAMEELRTRGLVQSVHGRGTFVV